MEQFNTSSAILEPKILNKPDAQVVDLSNIQTDHNVITQTMESIVNATILNKTVTQIADLNREVNRNFSTIEQKT